MKRAQILLLTATTLFFCLQSCAQAQNSSENGPRWQRAGLGSGAGSRLNQRRIMSQPSLGGGPNQGSLLDGTSPSMLDDPFKQTPSVGTGMAIQSQKQGPQDYAQKDGSRIRKNPDGSMSRTGADGTFLERRADGSGTVKRADGKEGVFNADGTGTRPDGTVISKDPLDGTIKTKRPDGLGFDVKPDGTKVFHRSNGLETVKTPDGKIYMRDSATGQSTRREIK